MYLDLRKTLCRRACLAAVLVAALSATSASQTRWNEKTILKFSEPVMVPNATLQPGTYVFKLMESNTNRHLVQISTDNGEKVVALTQAVPMKRVDPKGDVVLRFNPTDAGSPPAIKGWFYPGSVYGHEFVYGDQQAKDIAQRTKTVVLSIDVPGSDLKKGTLRVYNAEGVYGDWRGDPATIAEWREWDSKRATAPAIETVPQGMPVNVGSLEELPNKYIGQTVRVDAEIDRVYGPRLFTIDEPNWGISKEKFWSTCLRLTSHRFARTITSPSRERSSGSCPVTSRASGAGVVSTARLRPTTSSDQSWSRLGSSAETMIWRC